MARFAPREARLIEQLETIARLESHFGASDVVPERWKRQLRWRCANGHVSRTFAARRGAPFCKFNCGLRVYLTFPGDRSGPLAGNRALPVVESAEPLLLRPAHRAPSGVVERGRWRTLVALVALRCF